MTQHLEVQSWATNSELVEALFDIHVWPKKWARKPDGSGPDIMDVTHGRGIWWRWSMLNSPPLQFTSHDIRHDGVDYRDLPEDYESMDVVAFDPDYIAPGGRKTSTITEFNDRYGLARDYESPAALQASINAGIWECTRVLRPQGILLVKCTNYISSGKLWLGEYHTIESGLNAGLVVEDIAVHLGNPGPQPKRETKQQHLRSNSSRMIVFRKLGRRGKR